MRDREAKDSTIPLTVDIVSVIVPESPVRAGGRDLLPRFKSDAAAPQRWHSVNLR